MDSSVLNRFIFCIGRHCRCLLLLSLLFHRSIHPFTLSSAIWIGTNARIISNSHHFDLPKFRSVLMDYQKLIFFRTRTNNEIRKHSACNFRNNKNNLWKRGCLKLNTVRTLTLLLFSVPKLMCIPTLYWSFILKIYQDRAELQEVKVMGISNNLASLSQFKMARYYSVKRSISNSKQTSLYKKVFRITSDWQTC